MLPPSTDPNEADPVIEYITGEMNTNAHGRDAQQMSALNAFSATACIADWQRHGLLYRILTSNMPQQCVDQELSAGAAAMGIWALDVRQDGPWDHKPIIRKRFHPRVPAGEQVWHRIDAWEYYYDIWSNIHYGYVGKASGFSDSQLLDGAGLEQIGSDIFRRRMPSSRPGVSGARSFDDPSDQESISIGIRLWAASRTTLTKLQVRNAVTAGVSLTKRPAVPPAAGRAR